MSLIFLGRILINRSWNCSESSERDMV